MARQKQTVKELHVTVFLNSAKARAKRDNVPFSITKEYLLSIATDECPVFHMTFDWGRSGLGIGKFKPNCPTLDRIEPHLGYVEGNVAFISHRANRLKDNGTMQEHYDIADWIWSHLYAKPNTTPPVPKRTNLKGIVHSESRSVLASGAGKDYDNPNHYSGPIQGPDSNYRPQASSGNSVGCGSKEVEASEPSSRIQDNGEPIRPYVWP